MAHYTPGKGEPFKAASVIAAFVPVSFLPAGSSLDETVVRTGSYNEFSVGFTQATVASAGDPAMVVMDGRAKGIAGASLGAGAPLVVGSTNGILIPLLPSGLSTALGSAIGAAGLRYQVGRAATNAVAGDVFTVIVDVDQII
jgi:hypothetical protein